MAKVTIGAITIGQSPRVDMTDDMISLLSPNIELLEFGALDDYTYEDIELLFSPKPDDSVLVSRMRDGRQVILSEAAIIPLIQDGIHKAEEAGVTAILLLCTGKFPKFNSSVLLIYPQPIVQTIASKLCEGQKIGVMIPEAEQTEEIRQKWLESGIETYIVSGSPYMDIRNVLSAAEELRRDDISLICLDCMGYTSEMKNHIASITNKPVILPRTVISRIVDELYADQF